MVELEGTDDMRGVNVWLGWIWTHLELEPEMTTRAHHFFPLASFFVEPHTTKRMFPSQLLGTFLALRIPLVSYVLDVFAAS